MGRFFRFWNSIEISDDTYWQKITTESGKVIYKEHEEGSVILYYSDTDNGEDGDKEHVQSYKPYGLSDSRHLYYDFVDRMFRRCGSGRCCIAEYGC